MVIRARGAARPAQIVGIEIVLLRLAAAVAVCRRGMTP
jgi:hypothetical protein